MGNKKMTEQSKDPDYDKEINDILKHALEELDPELMETLKIISQMSQEKMEQLEVFTSYTGTTQSTLTNAKSQ